MAASAKQGGRDEYARFTEGSHNGLTAMFNELHNSQPRPAVPKEGTPGGTFSAADLEAEMALAAEEVTKPATADKRQDGAEKQKETKPAPPAWLKGPIGTSGKDELPSPQASKAAIPSMNEIGKMGAAAPSYTQLFEAKLGQRQKPRPDTPGHPLPARQEKVSIAASIFAPDPDEPASHKGKPTTSASASLPAATLAAQKEHPRGKDEAEAGSRGGVSGGLGTAGQAQAGGSGGGGKDDEDSEDDDEAPIAYPVEPGGVYSAADVLRALSASALKVNTVAPSPSGEKDEGVQAWLDQVRPGAKPESETNSEGGSMRSVVSIDSVQDKRPHASAIPSNASIDESTVAELPSRPAFDSLGPLHPMGASLLNGVKIPTTKTIYTDKFEEVAKGGSMPAFPAKGMPPPDAENKVSSEIPFPKIPSSAQKGTYTEAFSKGSVPSFPTAKSSTSSIAETQQSRGGFGCFSTWFAKPKAVRKAQKE